MPCATRLDQALRDLRTGPVEAEERAAGDVEEELRAIGQIRLAKPVEDLIGSPPGLAVVFSMIGGTAPISTALVTRLCRGARCKRATSPPPVEWPTMTASFRSSFCEQLRQVIGVGVHVVAIPGLTRATVAAPVVRDAAIAIGGQEEHLCFPGVRAERPAVAEYDRLSRAPILVVDLGAVFGVDRGHDALLR